jgi:hypothetical protein
MTLLAPVDGVVVVSLFAVVVSGVGYARSNVLCLGSADQTRCSTLQLCVCVCVCVCEG